MNIGLFHALPYGLKCLATGVVAKVKYHKKYGKYYRKFFHFLTENDVVVQQRQAEIEVSDFLLYAKANALFYRDYLTDKPEIVQCPVIDKSVVLANYQKFQCEKPFFVGKSSGTSGQPLKIPYSMNVYQKEYAFWWYHRSFGNVRQGDKIATFAGHKVVEANRRKPPFWVYNAVERQLFFSSYHLSEANMRHYVHKLNNFRPEFIHGYPSSIYFIARYITETGVSLSFRPKMIVTSSETTLDFQRAAIEQAFGCKVYVWYGNTELCGHITECSNGRLHVQPYHSYIRVVKENGVDAEPGETGQIIATNFSNFAFPLINYNIKDVVKISSNQKCGCSRGGLIIDYIIGRVEDYIITPNGRYIGRLDHLFKDAKYVRAGQVIQNEIGEIIIRIERSPGYSNKIEMAILKEARNRLGKEIKIVFDYDNPIEREHSGKFRFIVQNLKLPLTGGQNIERIVN